MTDFLTGLREELLDGLERHERTPRWRRRRGRRAIGPPVRRAVAAAAAAAAAVTGAVELADHSTELEQSPTPQVSRLEGFHANGFLTADGSLWVSQSDLGQLLRIDPRTGTVRKRIDVGGSPGTLITANGDVWAHDWERGRILKVDPHTNSVTKAVNLGLQTNGDIAFAAGALWMAGERMVLLRIDPDTAKVTKRVPLGGTATDPTDLPILAAAGNTLWVAGGDGGAVTELDARTGRILGRARGPALPAEVARRTVADDSGLWISPPTRRELIHIGAHTRRVTRIPLGADPGPIAIVDGRIWVGTVHNAGPVTRVTVLDDHGKIDTTLPVPNPTKIIAPSPGGGAWLTFGDNHNTLTPAALRIPNP